MSGRRRPQSASSQGSINVGGRPKVQGISYEDLLVAQYLDELKKSPQNAQGPRTMPANMVTTPTSPYAQRLASTHIVPTPTMHRRPQSAKPRVDAKYIADPDVWDPATPRSDTLPGRKKRPASAPVYKRPMSAYSRTSTVKSGSRRVRSLYKRQPFTIVVTAYKNGCRDTFARVAAPNIKILLEICTEKLELGTAARRVFLDDGTEVYTPREIQRDAEVYISMGEPFKNPYKGAKKNSQIGQSSSWTMNGLVWSQDAKKKKTKPILSKRFRNMIEQSRRRVLVFKNGNGSQGIEIVANPNRFEDFLVACTAKLDLGTYARVLYDWEGREITNLEDAPVLDECLQTWSTPVLGPLWVSKSEGFSPKGVSEFLTGLINYTKAKLKEAKHYQKQLQYAQEEETKEQVEIVAILSMAEPEIEETLEIVAKDIEDFTNALNRLKEQMEKISELCSEEINEGYGYTLKHIEKVESDNSKLIGTKGMKLKVYENGSYEDETVMFFNYKQATRGLGTDQKKMMERLLDQCAECSNLCNPKHNPTIRPMPSKLFDNLGHEIKSVWDLHYDQEVWLSFGEPWKNPFTFVLSAQLDKVRAVDINTSETSRSSAFREQLMTEDTGGKEKANQWECVEGLPDDLQRDEITDMTDPSTREILLSQIAASEISTQSAFLKSKDNDQLLLFPELVMNTKKPKGSKDIWPSESQVWVLNKNGQIFNKAMPFLAMAVTEQKVTASLGHPITGQSDTRVQGFAVAMVKRVPGSAAQTWRFTQEGFICAESQPELALTYLGSRFGDEDKQIPNEEEGQPSGERLAVAVCERLEGKDVKAQRWAIKQERMDNIGQWKHTQVDNHDWNKKALSWPLKEDGELNEDYDWPMEGYLLPYAPPLKKADKAATNAAAVSQPLRLMVMRNGVRDVTKAMAVVGPDLTNMRKDIQKNKKGKGAKKTTKGQDTESVDTDDILHCDQDLSVLKLEFILFLERCTGMLNLPFAARRLYDESGKEHFSLRSLDRDQLVYVSCGEPWSDPSLSKAEQQRRYLLSNLASDVTQIRQYVSLRQPGNFVVDVEGLMAGARVMIAPSAQGDEEEEKEEEPERRSTVTEQEQETEDAIIETGKMTAHETSHAKSEQRLNQLKWPWERAGIDQDASESDEEEQHYSNKALYRKFRTRSKKNQDDPAVVQQKFMMEDGFIVCKHRPDLCLGTQEQEGRVTEVILVKRRPDDINQRWILQEYGIIQSKHNPQMVLSVSMPSVMARPDGESSKAVSYSECSVTLQKSRPSQFGRAHQRWIYDEETGTIQAFATNTMDKEITAANRANVCTFSVVGGAEIDQPGYLVEMPTDKGGKPQKFLVCSSCARAMRGRYKLEKVNDSVDFACAMGNAKELGVRLIGSFQCLNGKVDLSEHEAAHTLHEWEEQLERLRDELSVRAIAREISAARVPYTVKVLVYKNGEGRMKPGELIVGSSVPGILEQATQRLSLGQAGRRLYTADGLIILDLDDLVDWVREQYVEGAQKQLRADARAKCAAKAQAEGGASAKDLMSKVELDSSDEDEEDDDEEPESEQAQAQEEEEEEEDLSPFNIGYVESATRQHMDQWRNCLVIPNPEEGIPRDGTVTSWKVCARQQGPISLQVYRQSRENLTAFALVGQTSFMIPAPGAYSVDIATKSPIPVKKGDVLAVYAPENPIIPYDIDESTNQCPYYAIPTALPEVGQELKMNTFQEKGSRQYSLNATIMPEPQPKKPAPPRRTQEQRMKSGPGKKKDKKKKDKGKKKAPQVEPPPVEMVLRYPIEVWVSSGEQFVKPEKVEQNYVQEQQHREERAAVSYELDKEKHVLRHMQGRRYDEANPGEYKSTRNPYHPVLMEGHWQEPTMQELQKHDVVHQLQTHLQEMKSVQRQKNLKTCNVKTTSRLYTQPSMKRVLIFPNGESLERAVYVWGENLQQLVDNATGRLSLRKPGKYLFNIEGRLVTDFDQVERDQLLCVGFSRKFIQPKESRVMVEVKANWGRARKRYGPAATDIMVTADGNPHVDVDPFGPSTLSGGPTHQKHKQRATPEN